MLFYLLILLRFFYFDNHMYLIWSNMYADWVYTPSWLILLVSVTTGDHNLLIGSGVVVAYHLWLVLPNFHPSVTRKGVLPGSELKVFSANLLMVNHNFSILKEIVEASPDVVCLQELSTPWKLAIIRAGLLQIYPYRIELVREDAFGTAIYSKLVLEDEDLWEATPDGRSFDVPLTRATVKTDSGYKYRIYNMHALPPRIQLYIPMFNSQFQVIIAEIQREIRSGAHVIVAGDFNMSQHNKWMHRLTSFMNSAHVLCGRGYAITFPNGVFKVPPIRLDHVLLSKGIQCNCIREGIGRGSDHVPLIFTVGLITQQSG